MLTSFNWHLAFRKVCYSISRGKHPSSGSRSVNSKLLCQGKVLLTFDLHIYIHHEDILIEGS